MVVIKEEDYLAHYGIIRRSGRYPWGSGGDNLELSTPRSLLDYVNYLRRVLGLKETEIAEDLGMSTTELRARKAAAKHEVRAQEITSAQALRDRGWSPRAIGERMNMPESTVRTLLAPGAKDKNDVLRSTADILKKQVDDREFIMVGTGVEKQLGVSEDKLKVAISMLENEGYKVQYLKIPQLGTQHETTVQVLTKDDVPWTELNNNWQKISQVNVFSEDGGRSYFGIVKPLPVDPDRLQVVYGPDGGADADGVIYVRPGVKDLDLGQSHYAQVRIQVGEDRYLKGMAIYKDDLPEGVDLQFNTNKTDKGNKLDALKKLERKEDTGEIDWDNPFGSQIRRQLLERDEDGKEKAVSAMNIVYEEGDWNEWSDSISAQVLSKQPPSLAKKQLDLQYETRRREFEEIMALTNPTVKRRLLEEFADSADASAVHLQAKAFPRQRWQVILPATELAEDEVYAPNFRDGEQVVLIRYPHGGTFEIPQLRVNNKNRKVKDRLGQARDAIAINPEVAKHLSGADFDGDTVLVIPNGKRQIKNSDPLEGLKDFDPQRAYPKYEGMKPLTEQGKQLQMGNVSNLITDMTIKGANREELAAAVRHSMVVIDAVKHELNWKESERRNGIRALKEKYQEGGASTLISKSGNDSEVAIPKRKPRPYKDGGPIDKATGRKVYVPTGESYVNNKGETVIKKERVPRLSIVDDLAEESSGTPVERQYVEYGNAMKALANEARRELGGVPRLKYSPSARKAYPNEVASLNDKLSRAVRNRPLERQAQVMANVIVRAKQLENPNMTKERLKKIKFQALEEQRNRYKSDKKTRIEITPDEWKAIQAGAISDSKLDAILRTADMDTVRELATPRTKPLMNPARTSRARSMMANGATREQIANALGVSISTLDRSLYGEGGSND